MNGIAEEQQVPGFQISQGNAIGLAKLGSGVVVQLHINRTPRHHRETGTIKPRCPFATPYVRHTDFALQPGDNFGVSRMHRCSRAGGFRENVDLRNGGHGCFWNAISRRGIAIARTGHVNSRRNRNTLVKHWADQNRRQDCRCVCRGRAHRDASWSSSCLRSIRRGRGRSAALW